jgi:hypothetical protein
MDVTMHPPYSALEFRITGAHAVSFVLSRCSYTIRIEHDQYPFGRMVRKGLLVLKPGARLEGRIRDKLSPMLWDSMRLAQIGMNGTRLVTADRKLG